MSNAGVLVVLCVAALLIVANFFFSLMRKRRNRVDYWLPDGTRLKPAPDKAEREHEKRVGAIEAERDALQKKLQAENVLWTTVKEKLDRALRRASD